MAIGELCDTSEQVKFSEPVLVQELTLLNRNKGHITN